MRIIIDFLGGPWDGSLEAIIDESADTSRDASAALDAFWQSQRGTIGKRFVKFSPEALPRPCVMKGGAKTSLAYIYEIVDAASDPETVYLQSRVVGRTTVEDI
jgi:hypothetical protein